jgi:tripartite-type tricarboxylate transporter receptor subunit TctC
MQYHLPRLFSIFTMLVAASCPSQAAGYTKLVVAFPPGGPADSLARVMAKQLESELKQTIIIDNRPGGNGAIAASMVAKAPADGSVLFLTSAGAIVINPGLYAKLQYDPMKELLPVSLVVNTPEVLVVAPNSPATNAADFVRLARSASKPPSLASTGIGSMPHMAIELFKPATKVDFLHVAYKGAAPAIIDTMGGQVDGFFGDASGLLSFINSKRLKPIGVAANKRLPFLPNVPTLVELGIKNAEASNWYGMMVPAGTQPAVVEKLNAAVRRTLETPAVRKSLEQMGLEPAPTTAAEFAGIIRADADKWARLIKERNIHAE